MAGATSGLDLLDTVHLSEDSGAWEVCWSHEKNKIPEGGSDSPPAPRNHPDVPKGVGLAVVT